MAEGQVREVSWLRRPRKPVPRLLATPLAWLLTSFWLVVALLVGLGVVMTEEDRWAKAGGGLVSLLSLATAVLLVAYMLRPVARGDHDSNDTVDGSTFDAWVDSLERHGYVEIRSSRSRIAITFAGILFMVLLGVGLLLGMGGVVGVTLGIVILLMAVFLALMPHLEFVTAGRPALRVDVRGIEIARWIPLAIPWTEVLSVRAHRSTKTQTNVVVHVTEAFYGSYLASRPFPLRFTDVAFTFFSGRGFAIPSTADAEPETLAAWLDHEARRRHAESAA